MGQGSTEHPKFLRCEFREGNELFAEQMSVKRVRPLFQEPVIDCSHHDGKREAGYVDINDGAA